MTQLPSPLRLTLLDNGLAALVLADGKVLSFTRNAKVRGANWPRGSHLKVEADNTFTLHGEKSPAPFKGYINKNSVTMVTPHSNVRISYSAKMEEMLPQGCYAGTLKEITVGTTRPFILKPGVTARSPLVAAYGPHHEPSGRAEHGLAYAAHVDAALTAV